VGQMGDRERGRGLWSGGVWDSEPPWQLSRLGVAYYGMLPSSKRTSSACLWVSVLLKMWWR
jgi:hypothetical protein